MLFLINPKRAKGRKRMATRRKKRASPAQLRALAKARRVKAAKRRKRSAPRKRRRTTTTRRKTVARRRTTKRRRAPRKRTTTTRRRKSIRFTPVRGRVYRKNPAFSLKGVMGQLQQGAFDAGAVVVGKAATRIVAGFIPIAGTGFINIAKQAGAALVVGIAAGQFFSRDVARFMVAGGLAAPIETFLTGLPVIGPALTGESALGEYLGYDLPIGEIDLPIGEYVEQGPMGEYVEQYA